MHDEPLVKRLELDGFVHLWGSAGAGKTLFATLLAADFSKYGTVEWINADAKQAFVRSLKINVKHRQGNQRRVNVTTARTHQETKQAIFQLTKAANSAPLLCIVDPITRALDLARSNPILWEQEFLEKVLPAVSGFASSNEVVVVATSEYRAMPGSQPAPILHNALSKWANCELLIKRSTHRLVTDIYRASPSNEESSYICSMLLESDGTLRLSEGAGIGIPRRH
ncbi:MAG: AAA family ATPase [Candidatus Thorarchaeota archaeon]|nr:AAA family ATPase [Candidatus Thorarchaeota archaeon]